MRFRGIREYTLIYFYETDNVGIIFVFLMHRNITLQLQSLLLTSIHTLSSNIPPFSRRTIRTIVFPPPICFSFFVLALVCF